MVAAAWMPIKDGDPRALDLYRQHYSYYEYKDGRRKAGAPNWSLIVGPGEKMVLYCAPSLFRPNIEGRALFVWRKFVSMDDQAGVNCAVFRNTTDILSSALIREAMELAWGRWPGERGYTYVNPRAIKSANPGYCFKMAGWKTCGETKVNRLVVLEVFPDE